MLHVLSLLPSISHTEATGIENGNKKAERERQENLRLQPGKYFRTYLITCYILADTDDEQLLTRLSTDESR